MNMFYSLKWWKGENGENYENGDNDEWINWLQAIISCYTCNMYSVTSVARGVKYPSESVWNQVRQLVLLNQCSGYSK